MLRIGTRAPDFETELNTGLRFRLRDQEGKNNVVLFFYPRDFTWGCTKEACSFSKHFGEIAAFDTILLGISADSVESHKQFSEAYRLKFPLGSDPDRRIARLYSVLLFRIRTRRLTYVIDKAGIIRGVARHELLMENHWKSVVRILKTLGQT